MTAIASHDRRDWDNPAYDTAPVELQVTSPPVAHAHHNAPDSAVLAAPNIVPLDDARRRTTPELTLVTGHTADEAWTRALESVPGVSVGRLLYATVFKRVIDIVLASILIVLCALPMLAVALWIKHDSPGKVLYRQRRLGYGRREFTMYKFRSMYTGSDDFLAHDPELTALYAAHWKLPEDPRITRSGAFLRKYSLDELPQLFNVIKGEMSLVGPRPYMPKELREEFGNHAHLITSVRPGMTGLWQISGRSLLTPSNRIELDERYIERCGPRYDAGILVKTVKVVVRSYGAF